MKILAVDYGDARTGLAICDEMEMLASPVGVISEWNSERVIEKASEEAKKNGAKLIVVGLPRNMDGTEGARAEACRRFAENLEKLSGIAVELWDERRTTITAHQIMNETNVRGKKRKSVIDAVAATVILESYLEFRKNKGLR